MAGGSIQTSGGRYKPQVGSQMASPNVIPMADIMLVLLIIFMVVTPMLQKNKPVDMASTNTARDMQDADKDDAIVVAVTRDGNIFLGNTQVHKEDMTGQVKDRISNTSRQDRLRQERCSRQVRRRRCGGGRNSLRRRRSTRSFDRANENGHATTASATSRRTVTELHVSARSTRFAVCSCFDKFRCRAGSHPARRKSSSPSQG